MKQLKTSQDQERESRVTMGGYKESGIGIAVTQRLTEYLISQTPLFLCWNVLSHLSRQEILSRQTGRAPMVERRTGNRSFYRHLGIMHQSVKINLNQGIDQPGSHTNALEHNESG